jgi:glycosyltransferase involved in cell wall biosynthesis
MTESGDLRVLLLTGEFPPDIGGIGSHVAELARVMASMGGELTVVHPQGLGAPGWGGAPEPAGVPEGLPGGLRVLRPALIKAQPFYTLMLKRWLTQAQTDIGFDLVHVHGIRPLGATVGLGVPTVFTNHSSGFLARLEASPWRRRRTARLLRHVAHVIGPSDQLVEAARAFGYAGPATMIANGVDSERFRPGDTALRQAWGIGADEVVVVLARRLVEKNGVVWFARAVALLGDLRFRVVIAGDGAERAEMTAILDAAGLLERVRFLGAVANTEMPAIYAAADLSVLPSLAEATSIAGLEAMASGLPLVGTRVGGIPTILEDGVTGLLVPPRDPKALAAALRRVIGDGELRRRFGAAARRKVEQEFSWPTIAGRTLAVYRDCLDRGARR